MRQQRPVPVQGPVLPRVRRLRPAEPPRCSALGRRRPDVVEAAASPARSDRPRCRCSPGPSPVTRPNGDLVVPYSFFAPLNQGGRGDAQEDRVAAVVSHDGGATFSQPVRIASLEPADDLAESGRRPCRARRSTRPGRCTSPGRTGASASCRRRERHRLLDVARTASRWTRAGARSRCSIRARDVHPARDRSRRRTRRERRRKLAVAGLLVAPSQRGARPSCPAAPSRSTRGSCSRRTAGETWAPPRLLVAEPIRLEWLADDDARAGCSGTTSAPWGRRPAVSAILPLADAADLGYAKAIFGAAGTAPNRGSLSSDSTSVAITNAMRWLNEIS